MSISSEITRIQNGVTTQSGIIGQIQTALAGKVSPGGVTVEPLTVTENGVYNSPVDRAYSPVTVNVPMPFGEIDITSNGTYDVSEYDSAVVNVRGDNELLQFSNRYVDQIEGTEEPEIVSAYLTQ